MVREESALLKYVTVVHLHAQVDIHLLQQRGKDLHIEGPRGLDRDATH